jgi:hypothetical protein
MLRTLLCLATALGLALLATGAAQAQREPPPLPPGLKPPAPPPAEQGRGDPPPLPQGLEVQARGPVHEAFAEPGAPPTASPVVPKQPPAPIEELPPEQRPAGEGVQWIPGYWQWDDERSNHIWVSGCWRLPPPGKVWLPGRWQQGSGGWQWVAGNWVDAQQSEVQLLPPPPPLKQEAVPQLSPGQVYEPGCWIYRARDYVWRPGFAVTVPKDWVWVSAQYTWTPAGCLFVEGHWDYPLRARGLLFAPVAFASPVVRVTQYVPHYVVREECLLGSLFVRPNCHHYYFGDYFETRYEKLGFVPWTRYRIAGPVCDSLFGYYRLHAGDRGWEQSLQSLYAARYAGQALRPPRTLIEQETFIRTTAVERKLTVNQVQQVTVLAPLLQYEIAGGKLEKLRREDIAGYRQSAAALAQFGQEFQRRESQVFSESRRAGTEGFAEGPLVVKWDKGHPHGGPPGQLKKLLAPPPFPGEDNHKGEKHKKEKDK